MVETFGLALGLVAGAQSTRRAQVLAGILNVRDDATLMCVLGGRSHAVVDRNALAVLAELVSDLVIYRA